MWTSMLPLGYHGNGALGAGVSSIEIKMNQLTMPRTEGCALGLVAPVLASSSSPAPPQWTDSSTGARTSPGLYVEHTPLPCELHEPGRTHTYRISALEIQSTSVLSDLHSSVICCFKKETGPRWHTTHSFWQLGVKLPPGETCCLVNRRQCFQLNTSLAGSEAADTELISRKLHCQK